MDAVTPLDGWTDQRTQWLIELWADPNMTAGLIAEKLGGWCSRSAVLGKVNRLRRKGVPLPGRQEYDFRHNRRQRKGKGGRVEFPPKFGGIPRKPPETCVDSQPPVMRLIPFDALDEAAMLCRWPIGDKAPYLFCGNDTSLELSYCPHHCLMAYRLGTS